MTGKDKIPLLLAEKGQELLNQLIPKIIDIADQTGILNIGELNEKLPDFCLQPDELNKILSLRNALVDKLNSATQTINSLKKIIDPLNTVVNINLTSTDVINKAIKFLQPTIPFLPSSPIGTPSLSSIALNTINILDKTLFNLITPKLITAQNTISAINITMDFVNKILLAIIKLLNSIDKYLKGCNINDLTSLDDSLIQLEQAQTSALLQAQNPSTLTNYKGFILEVVTEVYSPTVNRVKAVAKNQQGIILLQTPLSFTTIPQILIEEIKLIIDSNNLKAN
jgi:hypothetical protein